MKILNHTRSKGYNLREKGASAQFKFDVKNESVKGSFHVHFFLSFLLCEQFERKIKAKVRQEFIFTRKYGGKPTVRKEEKRRGIDVHVKFKDEFVFSWDKQRARTIMHPCTRMGMLKMTRSALRTIVMLCLWH